MFLLYVCNGQEGGWFGGVATVDEVRRPHKVVALTVYWALPPSPRTVQGSHSPHCPASPHFPSPLTQDPSLGPNPYPSPPYIPQPHILLEWGGSDVTTGSVVRVGGSEGAGEPDTSGCDVTSAPF